MTKPIFTTLDALRGAAAVIVVAYHAGTRRVPGGYLAVDLFFALSGFVLAHNYGGALNGWRDAGAFMVRRLIRLYPLYGLALAVGFGVHMVATLPAGTFWPSRALGTLAANAVFAPAAPAFLVTWHLYPFNPPAWSLFFELAVNALFALAAPFLRGWRPLLTLVGLGAATLIWVAIVHGDLNGGAPASPASPSRPPGCSSHSSPASPCIACGRPDVSASASHPGSWSRVSSPSCSSLRRRGG